MPRTALHWLMVLFPMVRIGTMALHMLDRHSPTEIHPQLNDGSFFFNDGSYTIIFGMILLEEKMWKIGRAYWFRDRINLELEGVKFVRVPARSFADADFSHLSLYRARAFSHMRITTRIYTIFSFKLVNHNNVSPQGTKKSKLWTF